MSRKNIFSYFKRDDGDQSSKTPSPSLIDTPIAIPVLDDGEEHVVKFQRVESEDVDINSLERDPGKRQPIWTYLLNLQDDVRRKYIMMGPCQPRLEKDKYPSTIEMGQNRRFQYSWFTKFPWLEYSIEKDKAFCFPCFLFESNPPIYPKFTIEGYRGWRRIHDSNRCSFLHHEGDHNSRHHSNVIKWSNLRNPSQHIDSAVNTLSSQEVVQQRIRLKATIEAVKFLAMQSCAFRGHDESVNSRNRGNFIKLLKYSARLSLEISNGILENAPKNAKYTSPDIQKQILNIIAHKVRDKIREEIGDAKFCILVDEALDESNQEQMAIIIRFVDRLGFVRERVFEVVSVDNTTALTLKSKISEVLGRYNLQVENMRGQGYDGASNMRGAWNGLQTLFLKECPCAYYVYCFAHRLQLALVASSNDVHEVWLFFSKLSMIVNITNSSFKRQIELKSARELEITEMIASGELHTSKGANQIRTLKKAGATRWSSHFSSISGLIEMFGATCKVLDKVSMMNTLSNSKCGEARGAWRAMRDFEFVFILHLLHEFMGITNILCQSLQAKSQDILNALNLVSSAKINLQNMREGEWGSFIEKVLSFCGRHGIDIPNMDAQYMVGTGRFCHQHDYITVEHYYHIDIFNVVIDFQLMELNSRFTDHTMELLALSSALNPIDAFRSFKINDICALAEKLYPEVFTESELHALRRQLNVYEFNVLCHPMFQNMSSLSNLCRELVESKKADHYYLVDRLIRLVLTLPVSTATTERAFSAMKLIKTTLRNKMEDEFLTDFMVVYIERDFTEDIDSNSIIDNFYAMKSRRVTC